MRCCIFVLVAAMLAACKGAAPSTPVAPSTGGPDTPPAASPTLTSLAISGVPASIAPNETIQLSAAGTFDSGDIKDVTQSATWHSSNDAACRVSDAGLLSGVGAGVASIEVRLGAAVDARQVTCGYVIDVVVHESEPTAQVLVSGARVEVVGGSLDGQTYLTDGQGHATLPPVASAGFILKFKKSGYDDGQWPVTLPRDRSIVMALAPNFVVTNAWSGTLITDLTGGVVGNTIFGWPREYRIQPHRSGDLQLDLQVGCVAYGTYTDFGFILETDSGRPAGSLYAYSVSGSAPYRYSLALPLVAGQGYRLTGWLSGFLLGPCPWSLAVRHPG